jgi:hypothetical protein
MDRTLGIGYQTIGGKRFFQDEDLGAAIQGSDVDEIFMNALQEMVIAPYEQLGITPSNATEGSPDFQLLQAIRAIGAGNFTSLVALSGGSIFSLGYTAVGIVFVNATAGNASIALPASAALNGQVQRFRFIRLDATSNAVTINIPASGPGSTDTLLIGGSFPLSQPGAGAVLDLIADGAGHWVAINVSSATAHGEALFTSGGSWTAPAGVTTVYPDACGGGGGGGYGSSGAVGGGGGGGGDWCVGTAAAALTVVPGTAYTITIGAAGTAGTSGSVNGGNGGATSIGALLTLNGGSGGTNSGTGGAGGSGSGLGGSAGQSGNYTLSGGSGSFSNGGSGGSGGFGAGGAAGWGAQAGQVAAGFGAGGGGGGAGNGAAGAAGFVRLRW